MNAVDNTVSLVTSNVSIGELSRPLIDKPGCYKNVYIINCTDVKSPHTGRWR